MAVPHAHTLSRSLPALHTASHTRALPLPHALGMFCGPSPVFSRWPSQLTVCSLHREAPPALCRRHESHRPHLRSRWVLMPTVLGAKASPWPPQVRVILRLPPGARPEVQVRPPEMLGWVQSLTPPGCWVCAEPGRSSLLVAAAQHHLNLWLASGCGRARSGCIPACVADWVAWWLCPCQTTVGAWTAPFLAGSGFQRVPILGTSMC